MHWYLKFRTDPNNQGQGIGTELITFVTQLANCSGHDCYLETFGPREEWVR